MASPPRPSIARAAFTTVERRRRLGELDALLDELELLNIFDVDAVSPELADRLAGHGVSSAGRKSPTALIEDVFAVQRRYLRPAAPAPRREPVPMARQTRPLFIPSWSGA